MKNSWINSFLENLLKVGFAATIMFLFFYVLYPFLISLLLGGILAMALSTFIDFLMKRGLSKRASIAVLSLILALMTFVPMTIFLTRGVKTFLTQIQTANIAERALKVSSEVHRLTNHISSAYDLDQAFVETKLNALFSYLIVTITRLLSGFLTELPYLFMMGFITILSTYFFLTESERIKTLFEKYFYFSKKNGDKFLHMLRVCCREVFFSNIITGVLQASIVALGSLIVGVGDLFMVFFITFFISFIPVIGAAPMAALLALSLFIESRMGAGIAMVIIAVVTGISDNIIRPYLGSLGEVKVSPFIGFLAVIGGVIMFGLSGLFIGPLVTTVIFGVLPIIIDEYFPSEV